MVGQTSGHSASNSEAPKGLKYSDRSVISMKLLLLHSFCVTTEKHFMLSFHLQHFVRAPVSSRPWVFFLNMVRSQKWALLKLTFHFKFHSFSFKIGITSAFCSGLSILFAPPDSLATLLLLARGSPTQPLWMALIGCPYPLAYGWIWLKGNDMSRVQRDREVRLLIYLAVCLRGYFFSVSLLPNIPVPAEGSFLQLQIIPGSLWSRGENGPLLLRCFTAPCWFPFIPFICK